jgi:hypothetical protein
MSPEDKFEETIRRMGFKPVVERLRDAKPISFRVGNLDPDNPWQMELIEEFLDSLRKLYQSLGGDDLIFTFYDSDGREVANPLPTCEIEATPFDMPPDGGSDA